MGSGYLMGKGKDDGRIGDRLQDHFRRLKMLRDMAERL